MSRAANIFLFALGIVLVIGFILAKATNLMNKADGGGIGKNRGRRSPERSVERWRDGQ